MSYTRYSKIVRRMWNDRKFRELSSPPPNGQTLWIRILTGPELGVIPGLFSQGEAGFAEALRWPLEGFRQAFAELSSRGMAVADWDARLVWVPKAFEHNKPDSPNVIKSWRMAWEELPECDLKDQAHRTLRGFVEGMGPSWLEAFDEACPPPSPNQEQEQDQEQEEDSEPGGFGPNGSAGSTGGGTSTSSPPPPPPAPPSSPPSAVQKSAALQTAPSSEPLTLGLAEPAPKRASKARDELEAHGWKFWREHWALRYGEVYPHDPPDGAAMKRLVTVCRAAAKERGDPEAAGREALEHIVAAYLADSWKGSARHALRSLEVVRYGWPWSPPRDKPSGVYPTRRGQVLQPDASPDAPWRKNTTFIDPDAIVLGDVLDAAVRP
jgi:hypothetical protein